MFYRNLLSLWFVLALVLLAGAPLAVAAQEATPTAARSRTGTRWFSLLCRLTASFARSM